MMAGVIERVGEARSRMQRTLPARCYALGVVTGCFLMGAAYSAGVGHWLLAAIAACGAGLMFGASRVICVLDAPRPRRRWDDVGFGRGRS